MLTGHCECGAVRFTVKNARKEVTQCHCTQCRRFSGHVWAATHAEFSDVVFEADQTLTWFSSSDFAKRGFCSTCGCSLFYRMNEEDGIGIAVGALDGETGMTTGRHIFVKDKGDYYDIADDAPQIERY